MVLVTAGEGGERWRHIDRRTKCFSHCDIQHTESSTMIAALSATWSLRHVCEWRGFMCVTSD